LSRFEFDCWRVARRKLYVRVVKTRVEFDGRGVARAQFDDAPQAWDGSAREDRDAAAWRPPALPRKRTKTMTEAEQAALDLLRDMRETLLALHEANMEKNSEISSLKDQMAAFQTADAQTAVAQEREWFDAFRSAVMPAPAPVEVPAEEPVEG